MSVSEWLAGARVLFKHGGAPMPRPISVATMLSEPDIDGLRWTITTLVYNDGTVWRQTWDGQ